MLESSDIAYREFEVIILGVCSKTNRIEKDLLTEFQAPTENLT